MNGPPQYDDRARQVAESARAFAVALERSPADQAVALEDLEQAGRSWAVQAQSIQRFSSLVEPEEAVVPLEDRLAAVATDLGIAEVLLAAGIAYGNPIGVRPGAPPSVVPATVPDCPPGFQKVNATGDAKGAHSFTCQTPELMCPPPPSTTNSGGMGTPATKTAGTGFKKQTRFSFDCSYFQVN